MSGKPEVVVVGCGVSGLSCGIRLLEQGYAVRIVARDLPPNTTSNAAAAVWYPFRANPVERVLAWGAATLEELYRLMGVPEAGVWATQLTEVLEQPAPEPEWCGVVRFFRGARPDELPAGYAGGYVAEVPMIDTPRYMPYLLARFEAQGGTIERRAITTLAELYPACRLIVNCSGVWAREVAADPEVFPIRGQIIRVRTRVTQRSISADSGPLGLSYILPRRDDCVLGGTALEHSWSLEPDPATAEAILRKCRLLAPELGEVEVLSHVVGLRPGRGAVRLEAERVSPSCTVIHNYGHGGAGFTLSWGCADEVARLALEAAG